MTAPVPPGDGFRPSLPNLAYVLPLRWSDDTGEDVLDELTRYLRWLCRRVEVVVVDGSPEDRVERHARAWVAANVGPLRHVPPDPRFGYANGKVNAVLTGLTLVSRPHVVIADDDVRYDEAALRSVDALLRDADVVRPQNYFRPAPWHARWDAARSLLNRAFGADYPGTLGVRRATLTATGGYDGDVLFENLELIRTVHAHGGTEARPLGLYVRRLPPDTRRFWQQRVRQAYDDFAQPARLTVFLGLLPALGAAVVKRRAGWPAAAAAGAVLAAELGRRRAGGTAVFPRTAPLFAPAWLLERAVCVWVAVGLRLVRGGVWYAGRRIRTAAHSERTLRGRRLRALAVSSAPAETGHTVPPARGTVPTTGDTGTGVTVPDPPDAPAVGGTVTGTGRDASESGSDAARPVGG